jgi:hypothetical protein
MGANFDRAISNLLDNAIEASLDTNRVVHVKASVLKRKIKIMIEDHGAGISEEVSKKLGKEPITVGKKYGTGLGVYQARKAIQDMGGTLAINSICNKGTRAIITLPSLDSPTWIATVIALPSRGCVVIADDDPSIHELWEERLGAISKNINIYHASNIDELNSISAQLESTEGTLFLLDFKLEGSSMTGSEWLKSQGNSPASLLVTGLWNTSKIREECEALSVKCLPKPLIPYVEIRT